MIGFPAVGAVGPEGIPGVAIFQGGVINSLAVTIDLEKVRDPAVGVFLLHVHQKLYWQLCGDDIADQRLEVTVFTIIGEHDDTVQVESHLCEIFLIFHLQDFGGAEFLAERCNGEVVAVVGGGGEAAADANCYQQGDDRGSLPGKIYQGFVEVFVAE